MHHAHPSSSILLFVLLIGLGVLVPAAGLDAQLTPCAVWVAEATVVPGDPVTLPVFSFCQTLESFSLVIAAAPNHATFDAVTIGPDLLAAAPDFISVEAVPGLSAMHVTCIQDTLTGTEYVFPSPPGPWLILELWFSTFANAPAGAFVPVDFPPLGASPVWDGFVVAAGGGGISFTAAAFIRGDCNDDGSVQVSDAVTHLGVLFAGDPTPTCLSACDVNDDGNSNIADVVTLLSHLFAGGPPPPAPYPDCGGDLTEDTPPCGPGGSACP